MLNPVTVAFGLLLLAALVWAQRGRRACSRELGRLREELRSSEEHSRLVLENTPEGVLELDASGKCLEANESAARILGRSREDLPGMSVAEMSPVLQRDGQPSAAVLSAEIGRALAGERPVLEWSFEDPEGETRPTELRMIGIPASGRVRASVSDVSGYIRAHQVLEESDARFRALVDCATEAIVLLDVESMRMAEVNPAAVALFGSTREELLRSRPVDLLPPFQPDGRSSAVVMEEVNQQVLEGRAPVEISVVALRAGGETFDAKIRSVLLPGERRQIRSTIIDVTDELETAQALRSARDEAEEANRAKTAFLAHMSHEIRMPMNGVLGMLALLLDSNLDAEQRQSAELARSSAEALLAILNDLLDISKIESGQFQLERIPFEPGPLTRSIVAVLSAQAASNGVDLRLEVAPEVPDRVFGDPLRVRQVISNLVSNAVKFTRDGEVLVRVSSGEDPGGQARLWFSVRDTGAGIAPERLGSIFDPFVQADASVTRRFGGTGLGLAICRQLVGLMGGDITVRSQPGRGSEFRFWLKLEACDGEDDAEAPPGEMRLEGQRVLLVDHSSTRRRMVRDVLETSGLAVTEVEDAYAALRAARIAVAEQARFELAIFAGDLPEEGAPQFLEAVRKDLNLSGMPLVRLEAGSECTAGAPGADEVVGLPAPLSEAALLGCVRERLGRPASGPGGRDVTPRAAVRRILLAEDNAVNQRVATAILRKRGYEVRVVGDGRAAVEAVREQTYDLVLMDVQMPELDGIEATRTIRAAGVRTRIVALTAHATADDRRRCLEAGMDDFLTKPFTPLELFRVVETGRAGAEDAPEETGSADPAPRCAVPSAVDLDGFRAAMEGAGVGGIVEETLASFLQEAPGRMEWLHNAVTSGDSEETRKAAHALKSSSAAIQAKTLAGLLERAETLARGGDVGGVAAIEAEIFEAYQNVVSQLENVLAVGT